MSRGPVEAATGERRADAVHLGQVTAYDEARAVGEVTDGHGGRWGFHCSAVADGSRSIAVGTPVAFVVQPGHHGRWEATAVTPR